MPPITQPFTLITESYVTTDGIEHFCGGQNIEVKSVEIEFWTSLWCFQESHHMTGSIDPLLL